MNKKLLLSILLVSVYFVMGVATSQYPRMGRTPMPNSPVNINDSKHILFFENFQNNKNDWIEGKYKNSEYFFDKGRYYMINDSKTELVQAEINQEKYLNESDDWIIETSLHIPTENPQGTAYILFGKSGDDFHCYGFSVKENNTELYYGSRIKGEWTGQAIPINNNLKNQRHHVLSIHKRGGSLDYYINKQNVGRGSVPKFYGNKIGLAVGGLIRASFDDITIKQLQFRPSNTTYSTNKVSPNYERGNGDVIPMRKSGERYFMPIKVNASVATEFVFDQWTTDVVISESLAQKLIQSGELKTNDWVGENTYTFEDGSKAPSAQLVLQQLKVGKQAIQNVDAMIVKNAKAEMMIGPTVLRKLGDYSFFIKDRVLLFKE